MSDAAGSTIKAGVNLAPVVNRGRFLRLLDDCRHQIVADLAPLLDATFERVDDALYDLADKAESDRLHTNWFDALRVVRRERDAIKRRFLRHLEDHAEQFKDIQSDDEGGAESPFPNSDRLTLVSNEELEESLMVANLVSKADSRYLAALRELTDDFAELMEQPTLATARLPFSPHAISTAFRDALRTIPELPLAAALVTYKVFDKQVMDRLEPTYGACVEFARELGLRAKPARGQSAPVQALTATGPRRAADTPSPARDRRPTATAADPPSRSTASEARAPGLADPSPAASPGPGAAAPCSFAELCQLLEGHPAMLPADAAAPVVGQNELLHALTRLQQAALANPAESLDPDRLRATLVANLAVAPALHQTGHGRPPTRRLERVDADAMDLVFLLFEQVLAAPDIPEPFKVLISRLQIPYVKLALVDTGFFEAPTHPARELLNHIAQATIGWHDDGERGHDALRALLQHLVERVVTELHTTPDLFAQLDAKLAAHLQPIVALATRTEAHTLSGASTRAQHQRASRRVLAAIDERLRGRAEVPTVVAEIIYEGWVEVLRKRQAEQGEGSAAWREALLLLERLLWSVEPKRDAAERRELLRLIPELLRGLREAMGTVVSDQRLLARWLKELQSLHVAVLRGPPAGAGMAPAPLPPDAPAPEDSDEGCDLDALPLGTWIALARDDGAWLRGKLAWRSADGEDLLLVDRRGQRLVELDRADLALMLTHDLAQVIGDGQTPLVDRALAAVKQTLTLC